MLLWCCCRARRHAAATTGIDFSIENWWIIFDFASWEICDDLPASTWTRQFFALVLQVRLIIRRSFPHLFVRLSIDRSGAFRLARRAVWENATVKRAFSFKSVLNMLQQGVQRVFNKTPSRDWQFNLTSTGIPLGLDAASRFPQASRPSPTREQFSSTQDFIKPSPPPGHGLNIYY